MVATFMRLKQILHLTFTFRKQNQNGVKESIQVGLYLLNTFSGFFYSYVLLILPEFFL